MKSNLETIIDECVKNGLIVYVDLAPNGTRAYRVDGFSKSGSALIYEDGDIKCVTRYNTVDTIDCFDDLVDVARRWFNNYSDREPFKGVEPEWEHLIKVEPGKSAEDSNIIKLYDDNLPF
jgi:hypothetical protein